jgi:hypothetical protein
MKIFTKKMLDEKFVSKAQQRFFYAQAGKKGKKGKKWKKWAKEFSDDTDFENLPEKIKNKSDVDEIVDINGNVMRGKKETNLNSKGVTSNDITDDVVYMAGGQMGTHGVHGTHTSLRYWAEGQELTKEKIMEIALKNALGAEETIMNPEVDHDDAVNYFEKELDLDKEDAEDRVAQLGYDDKLPDEQVRLVEKSSIEEFIENIIKKKSAENDLIKKDGEVKEINNIVKKQIKSLKQSMESNNLSLEDVVEYLKNNE